MIIRAPFPEEKQWCRDFLLQRGAGLMAQDAHFLLMQTDWQQPSWVVGLDGWVGNTCQMHMASNGRVPASRELARACFHYAFDLLRLGAVYGIVNSLNERALRLDLWLGFSEVYREPGLHESGGDIIVLRMLPEQYRQRWEKQHGKERAETA